MRPITTVLPGYENFYIYSAVAPLSGETFSLFLPWVNTEMMNIFLEQLSLEIKSQNCFIIMDQAGWHKSADLEVPSNIKIIYLPPYSPEINPVERLWQWLKRHCLRNRFYNNLDEVMDATQCLLSTASPSFLKSLCHCNYLLQ